MKTFVLFGSTGDLATRYVLPALGELLTTETFDHLVCVGRRAWTQEDFHNFLAPYTQILAQKQKVSYVRLDMDAGDFSDLTKTLQSIKALAGDIWYYLCLSPEYFLSATQKLAQQHLNTPRSTLIIEKPFGRDLRSAILLNLEIQKFFHEDRIYRIDHYLGKMFVQDLFSYRLAQGENWGTDRIAEIHILAREKITIEGRGAYYDQSGVVRDFFQNHLLQLLAIATMRMIPCATHDAHVRDEAIRDRLFQAISSISPLLVDPRHDIVLGQYEGYRGQSGVPESSKTPTYMRAEIVMDDEYWRGVKLVLESGKALDRKESSVRLVFRDGTSRIFSETPENKNNSYKTLFEKAFQHDATAFVRWDAIRAAWHVVDDLLACAHECPSLIIYPVGTSSVA